MPIFSLPNMNSVSTLEECIEAVAKLRNTLNYLLYNQDETNVTSLTTEYCSIHSEKGETVIDGPTLKMYDKQATPVLRLLQGYDPATKDFVFDMYNAAAKQTINLDSTGDYVFCGGTIRTDIVGKSRIELSGNSLKTYYNNGTTDYLNGPVWGVGSGARYGDLSFYDAGVETLRIENALGGFGWTIKSMNSGVLYIGSSGSTTYPSGVWNFAGAPASVSGLKVNVAGTVYSVYVG